jgi:hypothetical protein
MLTSGEDADVSFAPWSLRYSGHQFGQWAGQLGDGRAISIRVYFLPFALFVRIFRQWWFQTWHHILPTLRPHTSFN